jgi:hypothetical protein
MHRLDSRAEHLGDIRRVGEDERGRTEHCCRNPIRPRALQPGNPVAHEVEHDDEGESPEEVGVSGSERSQREEDGPTEGAQRREHEAHDEHADGCEEQHSQVEQEAVEHSGPRVDPDLWVEERLLHARPARRIDEGEPRDHGEREGRSDADRDRPRVLLATKGPATEFYLARLPGRIV